MEIQSKKNVHLDQEELVLIHWRCLHLGSDALFLLVWLMFGQIETDFVLKTANNQQDDQRLAWG